MSGDTAAAASDKTKDSNGKETKPTSAGGKKKPYSNGPSRFGGRPQSGHGTAPYYRNQNQLKFYYYDDPKYQCQFCSYKSRKVEDMSNHYKEKHDYVVQKTAELDKLSSDKSQGSTARHSLIFSPSNYIFISNPGEYLLDINEEQQEGLLIYVPHFLNKRDSDEYFRVLKKDLPWKQLESLNKHSNKNVKESRLSYYTGPNYEYGPVKWQDQTEINPKISELKATVEKKAGTTFNSALGILYRTGKDHMGWHSDDEPELGKYPTIASISFGATRYFEFSRNGNSTKLVRLALKHGDLLITSGCIQQKWKHWVPRDPDVQHCRINITFRNVDPSKRTAAKEAAAKKSATSNKAGAKSGSSGDTEK